MMVTGIKVGKSLDRPGTSVGGGAKQENVR